MSEVKRFSVGVDGVDPNGILVRYVDYADMQRRAEAAEDNYANEHDARKQVERNYERLEAALAEEKRINEKLREDRAGLARECNAFEAKLAELEKENDHK